jgi:hypothetical protein
VCVRGTQGIQIREPKRQQTKSVLLICF